MDARWQSFGSIRCGYTEFEGLKTSALGSAVVREVYVNSIAKHELTCPLCMSLEESHASICAAYCLHPLWFVDRKHTHTHQTHSHISSARLCVAPRSPRAWYVNLPRSFAQQLRPRWHTFLRTQTHAPDMRGMRAGALVHLRQGQGKTWVEVEMSALQTWEGVLGGDVRPDRCSPCTCPTRTGLNLTLHCICRCLECKYSKTQVHRYRLDFKNTHPSAWALIGRSHLGRRKGKFQFPGASTSSWALHSILALKAGVVFV